MNICVSGRSSGLSASCNPSHTWNGTVDVALQEFTLRLRNYSYGDSAGFAPDFPFHHALREPFTAAKVVCCGKVGKIIFNMLVEKKS